MNQESGIKISVIIPVYNVEAYLAECLDSLLQNCSENFEIICIDDYSDDNSIAILEQYSKRNNSINLFVADEHIGVADARNMGIQHARGEYILFVDSDDMLLEGTLQHLVDIVSEQDYDEVFFNFKSIYESESIKSKLADRYISKKKEYEGEWQRGIELFCSLYNNNDLTLTVWSQMYRRQFLLDNNVKFESGILHEDVPFAVISMWMAKRVYYTNRECYVWRHRVNSITTQDKTNKHIEGRVIGLKKILDFLYEYPVNDVYYEVIEKFVEKQCLEIKYNFQEIKTSVYAFKNDFRNKLMLEVFLMPEKIVRIKEECLQELRQWSHIIVYGAGKIASLFLDSIGTLNKCIRGIVVTDPNSNQEYFYGHKICSIDEMLGYRENTLVCVALSRKNYDEVSDILENAGFKHIVLIECEVINKKDILKV